MVKFKKLGLVKSESQEVQGIHPFWIVGVVAVAVTCFIFFGFGVYNGYKNEEAKNKPAKVVK